MGGASGVAAFFTGWNHILVDQSVAPTISLKSAFRGVFTTQKSRAKTLVSGLAISTAPTPLTEWVSETQAVFTLLTRGRFLDVGVKI